LDIQGNVLGRHKGIIFYTIGQRGGLGISSRIPRYVISIDHENNSIVVGGKNDLKAKGLVAGGLNMLAENWPRLVSAKIRYRKKEAPCAVTLESDSVSVTFAEEQEAITPGQSVVFYTDDRVLGGESLKRFCMELVERINRLRKERNAVILAHNYQIPKFRISRTMWAIPWAEHPGVKDSCCCHCILRVYFMAETAKILSPEKTVLIPDANAGCPMADMITSEELRKLKREHPRAKVLCYVNTTAEVKAECDVCCTSGNAERIVREAFGVTTR